MTKNYISSLLVVLLAGAHVVHAQESMDDVFAQLDSANEAGGSSAAAASVADPQTPVAATDPVEVGADKPAPTALERDLLSMLFDKGLAEYKAGQYHQAILAFDAILSIDAYNRRGMDYRKRCSSKIRTHELNKQTASRAQAIADIEAAWNEEPKVLASVELNDSERDDPTMAAVQRMEQRLKAIIIPSLDFSDASIEDVILFLAEASRRMGTEDGDVDFLLVGMEYASGQNSVTLSIADMSLYEALQFVVEMTSLKFEIKPTVVSIMPVNYVPQSDMVMTSYNILPEVGTDLESLAGDAGGAEDLFGDSSSGESTGPVDVAGFFAVVDFPEGASAVYQPRFNKLFVKNTPANTKEIELMLNDLGDAAIARRSQQVEIETKFVEFNEGALEELGFDWNIYGNGSTAGLRLDPRGVAAGKPANTANTVDPRTGQTIYTDNINRAGQNLFGGSQRSNGAVGGGGIGGAFESVQSGLLSVMGGAAPSMLFGNEEIDVKISALEQEGTADVLSAPRVTTKSGSEAVIRVAETHRYPQDYDVETGQRTAPVVKPQDWEDFDLGVTLRVTPVVDSESNTIDLELEPEIIRFRGFDTYSVGFNAFDGGGNNTPAPGGTGEELFARMPYFERRSVQTQVTIADGQTVVMGGMIDERTETFRDQVPFLGDIPYLGRLFRTEGSRTSKKNLVIYVKATQVDARGMTQAQRDEARGLASN